MEIITNKYLQLKYESKSQVLKADQIADPKRKHNPQTN